MTNRYKKAQKVTIISMVVNVILTIIKFIGGIAGNSHALIADAIHSVSDFVSSIAVLIGLKIAQKPPDKKHPYGYGKSESVTTLVIAMVLVIVGFQNMYTSIESIWMDTTSEITSMMVLYIIILGLIVKELLFQYKFRAGTKLNSPALIADAWHHRSDAISSAVALVGVGLALVGSHYGIPYLSLFDPIAGAGIAIIIMYMGFKLAKEAVSITLEVVLNEEETTGMKKTATSVDKVIQVDDLRARSHGSYVVVEMNISVEPNTTVEESHRITRNVKQKLINEHDIVRNVHVHVDPYDQEDENEI